MTTYKVECRDNRSHYVLGLGSEYTEYPDSMLIYRYPGGDVDTKMNDAHMMLSALYDLFQIKDELKDGDKFETEFGEYECKGVHVVSNFEMPPEPKREETEHHDWW